MFQPADNVYFRGAVLEHQRHQGLHGKQARKLGIRAQLLLLVFALFMPFLAYVLISAGRQASEDREEAGARMLSSARLTASRLDDYVGDIYQMLSVLSTFVDVTPPSIGDNDATLRELLPKLPPHINNVAVWNAQGLNVGAINTRVRLQLSDASANKFFRGAFDSNAFFVEAPVVAASNKELIGVFAMPVVRAGQVVGVVTVSAQLRPLQSLLDSTDALPSGAITSVIDVSGIVLARSVDAGNWIGRNVSGINNFSDTWRRKQGVLDRTETDGVQRIAGFTMSKRMPWLVNVEVPEDFALSANNARMHSTLAAGCILLLVGLGCATFAGERIASPLRRLQMDAELLERGELSHRSQVSARSEIGALAATFNRMANTLQLRNDLIQRSQEELRQITDNLPALISYIDRERRFRFVNRVYEAWLGRSTVSLLGQSLEEVYGSASYADFSHHIDTGLSGQRVIYERDMQLVGPRRWFETTLIPDVGSDGSTKGLFVLMQDITARREMEAHRARSEERLSLSLESSRLAIFDWDIQSDCIYHSAQAAVLRGGAPVEETAATAQMRAWVHPDDLPTLLIKLKEAVLGITPDYNHHFRVWSASGNWIWLRARGRVVERTAEGRAARLAGTYADITERMETEARLREKADFDFLTGLPNRALFLDRLECAISASATTGRPMALMFLDIDHFKQINDTHGHEAGDELLKSFAQLMTTTLRFPDTVARLAGDEFTIILEGLQCIDDAHRIAATLVERTRLPMRLGQQVVQISTSIGVAWHCDGLCEGAVLLKQADVALYAAKRNGRNGYVIHQ
ncbi:MAG: diguanylate cyclase [Cytophagaceae bacterium]|nr:MAG: diguanylate cyclase [Cytophagaceae bacterium]